MRGVKRTSDVMDSFSSTSQSCRLTAINAKSLVQCGLWLSGSLGSVGLRGHRAVGSLGLWVSESLAPCVGGSWSLRVFRPLGLKVKMGRKTSATKSWRQNGTLHTAAELAVRAAVKNERSNRNNTIRAFLFAASHN